eukprot:5220193-Amphidinium_carterae.2
MCGLCGVLGMMFSVVLLVRFSGRLVRCWRLAPIAIAVFAVFAVVFTTSLSCLLDQLCSATVSGSWSRPYWELRCGSYGVHDWCCELHSVCGFAMYVLGFGVVAIVRSFVCRDIVVTLVMSIVVCRPSSVLAKWLVQRPLLVNLPKQRTLSLDLPFHLAVNQQLVLSIAHRSPRSVSLLVIACLLSDSQLAGDSQVSHVDDKPVEPLEKPPATDSQQADFKLVPENVAPLAGSDGASQVADHEGVANSSWERALQVGASVNDGSKVVGTDSQLVDADVTPPSDRPPSDFEPDFGDGKPEALSPGTASCIIEEVPPDSGGASGSAVAKPLVGGGESTKVPPPPADPEEDDDEEEDDNLESSYKFDQVGRIHLGMALQFALDQIHVRGKLGDLMDDVAVCIGRVHVKMIVLRADMLKFLNARTTSLWRQIWHLWRKEATLR